MEKGCSVFIKHLKDFFSATQLEKGLKKFPNKSFWKRVVAFFLLCWKMVVAFFYLTNVGGHVFKNYTLTQGLEVFIKHFTLRFFGLTRLKIIFQSYVFFNY